MPFEFAHITVEVKDSTEGDERTFIVTLKAPANRFQMTNHLQQRGVIEPLDGEAFASPKKTGWRLQPPPPGAVRLRMNGAG